MKPRVFVVQPIPEEGLRMLQAAAEVDVFQAERMISRDELIARVKRCDYLYTLGDTPIDAEVLDANPNLKGIAAMTMIPNVIDVAAMTKRKIPLTNIPHIITKTTCDLTVAIILGLACRLVEADRFTREGRFHQEQSMTFLWHSLPGKIAGFIGLGGIGRRNRHNRAILAKRRNEALYNPVQRSPVRCEACEFVAILLAKHPLRV